MMIGNDDERWRRKKPHVRSWRVPPDTFPACGPFSIAIYRLFKGCIEINADGSQLNRVIRDGQDA